MNDAHIDRIAIPSANGRLALHFGHCDAFHMTDVDLNAGSVAGTLVVEAPPHQPGLLPRWLADYGVTTVIAGGMGQRARALFEEAGITVHTGAGPLPLEDIVAAYLDGSLELGANVCDH
jgi:predicted Fe-Mo cluster-binding NifX family protein